MRIMSYTESRAKYADMLTSVVDDCEEVIITRAGHEPVVVVSLAEYESLKETAYLLRSPANARMLKERIARVERGQAEEHELIEDDTC
ncbi:type II toxin-antitoxin system prevent-host-death family antitoxin [Corynebacterium aquatimens]|uniref:type II toxin-antitoxin system Phd/YefM family antitoxin n=1 Tax=Corynebacterium TaxID=1716 RepID=UPI001F2BD2AA|nr:MULTISPECIES: type II toxin-antitoxin system prevent-host-death family antitoxin [Corynebacterium]QYH19721.1 type II toxin-antitoxin system prevent-host-death family antitoxin [Corynebacterium aquatimens]UIZ93182.1 type II toxin-antitoxin system prevent-host-death family antitoxin [Corynebacterium sp. CNCTC7651]